MVRLPLRTYETVLGDTPACFATSPIVAMAHTVAGRAPTVASPSGPVDLHRPRHWGSVRYVSRTFHEPAESLQNRSRRTMARRGSVVAFSVPRRPARTGAAGRRGARGARHRALRRDGRGEHLADHRPVAGALVRVRLRR